MGWFNKMFFPGNKQRGSKLFSKGSNRPFRGTDFFEQEKKSLASKECCRDCVNECDYISARAVPCECPGELCSNPNVFHFESDGGDISIVGTVCAYYARKDGVPLPRYTQELNVIDSVTRLPLERDQIEIGVVLTDCKDNCFYPLILRQDDEGNIEFTIFPEINGGFFNTLGVTNGCYTFIVSANGYNAIAVNANISGPNQLPTIELTPNTPGKGVITVFGIRIFQYKDLITDFGAEFYDQPFTVRFINITKGTIDIVEGRGMVSSPEYDFGDVIKAEIVNDFELILWSDGNGLVTMADDKEGLQFLFWNKEKLCKPGYGFQVEDGGDGGGTPNPSGSIRVKYDSECVEGSVRVTITVSYVNIPNQNIVVHGNITTGGVGTLEWHLAPASGTGSQTTVWFIPSGATATLYAVSENYSADLQTITPLICK